MSRSPRSRRRLIEEIIGKDVITHLVKGYTMPHFLNNRVEELYERGLSIEEIKTEYMVTLVKELNRRYIKVIRSKAAESGITNEIESAFRNYIKGLSPEVVDKKYIISVVNELNKGYVRSIADKPFDSNDLDLIDEIKLAIQIIPFTERDIEKIELRKRLPETIGKYLELLENKYEELEDKGDSEESVEEQSD